MIQIQVQFPVSNASIRGLTATSNSKGSNVSGLYRHLHSPTHTHSYPHSRALGDQAPSSLHILNNSYTAHMLTQAPQ